MPTSWSSLFFEGPSEKRSSKVIIAAQKSRGVAKERDFLEQQSHLIITSVFSHPPESHNAEVAIAADCSQRAPLYAYEHTDDGSGGGGWCVVNLSLYEPRLEDHLVVVKGSLEDILPVLQLPSKFGVNLRINLYGSASRILKYGQSDHLPLDSLPAILRKSLAVKRIDIHFDDPAWLTSFSLLDFILWTSTTAFSRPPGLQELWIQPLCAADTIKLIEELHAHSKAGEFDKGSLREGGLSGLHLRLVEPWVLDPAQLSAMANKSPPSYGRLPAIESLHIHLVPGMGRRQSTASVLSDSYFSAPYGKGNPISPGSPMSPHSPSQNGGGIPYPTAIEALLYYLQSTFSPPSYVIHHSSSSDPPLLRPAIDAGILRSVGYLKSTLFSTPPVSYVSTEALVVGAGEDTEKKGEVENWIKESPVLGGGRRGSLAWGGIGVGGGSGSGCSSPVVGTPAQTPGVEYPPGWAPGRRHSR
ncbi:hypothetical protein SAICODRAFT_9805 [Saitoella complicata NRRL Y-17804]|uniref:Uncharacterized protein n=1 Tax=Saitoella complicata (strain BCRC 22490 / CBS 7301 / JCM 7358 / NBRC 10748 / NRRL Y-17804) TaxID=698492 RepID=A0A0E9NKD6_SAICN|nr:uncharacterized protein SAICODRAFT_9805 [Saitoella complicata NRRL Y-17804]ODQ50529.1 hypothetical protein SAICODRAFT_9805 [Saitoella complicata NRRL Y-17804]GAO50304.1 hypothetical protein G7K_4434-t1 [Saitoella complicata NRRL Y-17804]